MAEQRTLRHLIREDYEAHGREWTRPGFLALVVHRFGEWRMGIEPRLLRAPLSVGYRMMFRMVRNVLGIELPYTVRLGRRVVLEHQHGVVIHGAVEIGDDCVLRQGVTLGIRRLDALNDAPVLGKRVDVGAGAKILGHVRIGDDACIGANAVVLDDVPAGATVVGVPARVVKRRHSTVARRGSEAADVPPLRVMPSPIRIAGASTGRRHEDDTR